MRAVGRKDSHKHLLTAVVVPGPGRWGATTIAWYTAPTPTFQSTGETSASNFSMKPWAKEPNTQGLPNYSPPSGPLGPLTAGALPGRALGLSIYLLNVRDIVPKWAQKVFLYKTQGAYVNDFPRK